PANNSATATTMVAVPDLTVTKTASPSPVVAGTNLTYSLTVTNPGPGALTNVSLADALPISTPFVSLGQTTGPAFTCTTPAAGGFGTVSCTIASLLAGSATFSLVVHVNANLDDGFVLANTATVASSPVDANLSNNTATSMTTVQSRADVGVTKTDSPDPVVAGTNLTYTITVANNGPSHVLTGLTLSDAVPTGATFVSFNQSDGPAFTCTMPAVGATGNISCTIATFTAGSVATFTLVIRVNPGATGNL